jgi:hypothetical protein
MILSNAEIAKLANFIVLNKSSDMFHWTNCQMQSEQPALGEQLGYLRGVQKVAEVLWDENIASYNTRYDENETRPAVQSVLPMGTVVLRYEAFGLFRHWIYNCEQETPLVAYMTQLYRDLCEALAEEVARERMSGLYD